MQSITRCASGVGKQRTGAVLVVVATLAVAACSKTEKSTQPSTFTKKPTTSTVVTTEWGAQVGKLGRNIPEEGLPEGPKSFAVDAAGTLHVLDQENGRIQKFAQGKSAGVADLPPRPLDDIELDGSNGYAVLDVHEQPAVVFLDAAGLPKSEVTLNGSEIPEPSLVTALVRGPNGFYVEVADEYLVHVTDSTGAAVAQTVVPGQVLKGSSAFKIDSVDSTHLSIFQIATPDVEPVALTNLAFPEHVGARTLFAAASDGGFLVAVKTSPEQTDPESTPAESHSLVSLDANGTEQHRVPLPTGDGVTDMFRSVKRGEDGNVYVMTATELGVEIVKVSP